MNTNELILQAGKEEFLIKGFEGASLRTIAASAGVTTGAIYGYYVDKSALFEALVEPAASEFHSQFMNAQNSFQELPKEEQVKSMLNSSNEPLQYLLDYIYDHFDSFQLIACSSSGTKYEYYIEELVHVETEATYRFWEVLNEMGYHPAHLTKNLVHILSNAYFSAIFETVAHGMEKEEADQYVAHLTKFFWSGWHALMINEK